jgi:putative antitoxin of VapBC-like toxin-antitoxin system
VRGFFDPSAGWRLRAAISVDMVTHMKTTIEISDPLLAEAKAVAAREHRTLRELVEEGLRRVLKRPPKPGRFKLRDASFKGRGLRAELVGQGWDRIRAASYEGRGG